MFITTSRQTTYKMSSTNKQEHCILCIHIVNIHMNVKNISVILSKPQRKIAELTAGLCLLN